MKYTLLACVMLLLTITSFTQNIVFQKHLENNRFNTDQPVSFFVEGNKAQLLAYLKKIGGTYKYSFKNKHHITLKENQIDDLAKQPFISHLDYRLQQPVALNDSMRVKARINPIHQGMAPLPQDYRGRGILVGFIDDGIDFNHPDFKDSAGRTRVLRIWDQSQPFNALRTPPAYGYGQLWDSTDINNGICTSTETSGHGTTVAGTASGNGLSTGTHWGAAPSSVIVMVKSNFAATNWMNTVADAVDYMYKLADSLGLPCVINASVGDYYGSHDGRDIPALFMDSLIRAKRGRLMVAALGNSGTLPPYHLETNVNSDTSFTWFEYNAPGGGDAFPYGSVYFEVFADTADMQNVQFSMGADKTTPFFEHRGQAPFRNAYDFLGTTLTDTIFSTAGNVLGIVDYYAEIQGSLLFMQVHMQEPDSNNYYFRFSSFGNGRFDVWSGEWLGISDMVNTGLPSAGLFPDIVHYVSPDSAKTMVSSFQCLESVVSVANYNNIQNYIGYDMNPVSLGEPEGAIASSSSRGPTRDNRQKPDVAATGNVTFSPGPLAILSTLISVAPFKLLPDGMHMRNGGTSMASPVVAGIGALLLERCPQLSWEEFKSHINTTAYTDSFTGTVPNISFGYGKVDAFEAMQQTIYAPSLTGDFSICEGDVAQLLAPTGFQSYVWDNGDTTYYSSTDTTSTHWMIGVDAAGCTTDTAYISVVEYPLPVVSISVNTGLFSSSAPGALIYQWYYNGAPVSGATSDTLTAFANGDYFVSASDGNGCTGNSDTLNFTSIGMSDINNSLAHVYPNPFSGLLHINATSEFDFTLINTLGEVVYTGAGNSSINTAKLPIGIYYLVVVTESNTSTHKLIKQ